MRLRHPTSVTAGLGVVLTLGACFLSFRQAASAPPQDQHLEALGVARWHTAGICGAGIKVAVLDSGFRGYREHLGKALPERVVTRSFRRDGNLEARDSPHGVMCAEIIHAIAPNAELLFANWEPDDAESFVAAARWCRAQGARVVSCSVVMPAWSDAEGGGSVHQELADVFGDGRKADDMLAFAPTGNLAPRHWGGRFSDDGHGFHRWGEARIDNSVTPWGGERVSIELVTAPTALFEVQVFDTSDDSRVGEALTRRGSDRSVSVVRFVPRAGHSYKVRVRHLSGEPGAFHLFALGAWLEHFTAKASIPFPGDGAEWLTVGAVDQDGQRLGYSSCGPTSPRPKPDLCAIIPFPTRLRPQPFAGTSPAAPQAAALAALAWSRHPEWPAARVRETLLRDCQDLGPKGHDYETGHGRIRLSLP